MSTSYGSQALEKYAEDLGTCAPLAYEEERRLARDFAAGDEAAGERIVRSHLRYVVDVAGRFMGRGVALEDLIQEGNIGLLKALSRYDAERLSVRSLTGSVRFIAYATPWVKAGMRRAIEDGATTVRIGPHLHLAIAKMRKLDRLVCGVSGRHANDTEVAEHLCIKREKARVLRAVQAVRFASFDESVQTEKNGRTWTLHDIFAADAPAYDEVLAEADLAAKRLRALEEATKKLGGREGKILRERLLRDPDDRKTHLQLGREMGIGRTRVQQLELRLMKTLRSLVPEILARQERKVRC